MMEIFWNKQANFPLLGLMQGLPLLAAGLLLLLFLRTPVIGWHHADVTGRWSLDVVELQQTPPVSHLGAVAFFLLFYGLAIRIPLFPLNGWLPTVAHHGNVAVAPALLLGVKVGIYGMVRFVMPLVPEAVNEWHFFVATFAAARVFYAAFLAFLQKNLRRLMAFAVVSHTSQADDAQAGRDRAASIRPVCDTVDRLQADQASGGGGRISALIEIATRARAR